MKIGVTVPQFDLDTDVDEISRFAETIEELGYRTLLAFDHVLGEDSVNGAGFDVERSVHEPLTLFSYLSGVTDSITLVTGILILPQRQTALVAKQVAEVSGLSGGRICLGVGVGWNRVEYSAMGVDFGRRGSRIEEQIRILRKLWNDRTVSFEGEFHDLPDVGINPRPVADVPIWIGGGADIVLERAARMADGWIVPNEDFATVRTKIERIREYLGRFDRDPDRFDIVGRMSFGPWGRINGPERDRYQERIAFVREWDRLGVDHLVVSTLGEDRFAVSDHLEHLTTFADELERSDIDVSL